jgi:hypothetical protein
VVVVVILFFDPGGGENFLGALEPLLVEVEFASGADMPLEVMFISLILIDFDIVLHGILADDAPDDIELILVIDAFKLRLLLIFELGPLQLEVIKG